MMKVIRYSVDGFKVQYQSNHMKSHVLYHLKHFDLNVFPEHLRWEIKKIHDRLYPFYKENFNDFRRGIWVFIDGYKDNQSLNHLKKKVPCYEAELPDDIIVYDVNWTKQMKLSDPECKIFGCYVPERSLVNLKNVKRRKNEKKKEGPE